MQLLYCFRIYIVQIGRRGISGIGDVEECIRRSRLYGGAGIERFATILVCVDCACRRKFTQYK